MSYDDHISTRPYPGAGPGDDDWSVISIADPDGAGADGAFTDGLVNFGLPELVVWARPSTGDDPGADWLLTHDDRLMALDEWACDLIDGLLAPDDVQSRTFDHGYATVTFRFSPPRTAQAAGINELPPERQVIVVGWSLNRRTTPSAPDPSSAGVRRVQRWLARTTAITANWRLDPGRTGRSLALPPVSAGHAARFGPMSEWVHARIEQVQTAGEMVLAEFFERIPMAALVQCDHCVHQDLMLLASRSGRGGAAREAINAAQLCMPALTDGLGDPASGVPGLAHPDTQYDQQSRDQAGEPGSLAWQVLLSRIRLVLPASMCGGVHEVMRFRLRSCLESLLVAAVVGDLAPPRLMARACGSWEWAVHGGRVPGRAWLTPASARQETRRLLTGSDGQSLLLAAVRDGGDASWQDRLGSLQPISSVPDPFGAGSIDELLDAAGPPRDRSGVIDEMSPADRTAGIIGGLQTVAGGSARPGWLFSRQQRIGLSRRQVRIAEDLAAPLLTAIALPARLQPDTWAVLTAPLRRYIPRLPDEPPVRDLAR